jgi:hypothetical protein
MMIDGLMLVKIFGFVVPFMVSAYCLFASLEALGDDRGVEAVDLLIWCYVSLIVGGLVFGYTLHGIMTYDEPWLP